MPLSGVTYTMCSSVVSRIWFLAVHSLIVVAEGFVEHRALADLPKHLRKSAIYFKAVVKAVGTQPNVAIATVLTPS